MDRERGNAAITAAAGAQTLAGSPPLTRAVGRQQGRKRPELSGRRGKYTRILSLRRLAGAARLRRLPKLSHMRRCSDARSVPQHVTSRTPSHLHARFRFVAATCAPAAAIRAHGGVAETKGMHRTQGFIASTLHTRELHVANCARSFRLRSRPDYPLPRAVDR